MEFSIHHVVSFEDETKTIIPNTPSRPPFEVRQITITDIYGVKIDINCFLANADDISAHKARDSERAA